MQTPVGLAVLQVEVKKIDAGATPVACRRIAEVVVGRAQTEVEGGTLAAAGGKKQMAAVMA